MHASTLGHTDGTVATCTASHVLHHTKCLTPDSLDAWPAPAVLLTLPLVQIPGRLAQAVALLWGQHATPSEAAALLLPQLQALLEFLAHAVSTMKQHGMQDTAAPEGFQAAIAKQLMQSGLMKLLPRVLTQAAEQLQAACSTAADGAHGPLDLQGLTASFRSVHPCALLVSRLWPGA